MSPRFAEDLCIVLKQLADGHWHRAESLGYPSWGNSMRARVVKELVHSELADETGRRAGSEIRIRSKGERLLAAIKNHHPVQDEALRAITEFVK